MVEAEAAAAAAAAGPAVEAPVEKNEPVVADAALSSTGFEPDAPTDAIGNGDSLISSLNPAVPEAEETEEVVVGADTQCGLGSWRPAWLQRLASKKAYVVLHGLIGFQQIATGCYFVATISTMEKRFKIPSRTTGIISSAWDMGACCSLLFLGYLGRHGHKPRMVAVGMLLMAAACFVRVSPHFLYGPGHDALALTKEYADGTLLSERAVGMSRNASSLLCGGGGGGSRDENEDCSESGSLSPPAIILFVSSILMGVGSSAYWTLGMAYLDDNTHKDKAPVTLAATSCIRLVGPTAGFAMASYALSQYVAVGVTPLIDQDDPRWIGAWWLGYCPSIPICVVLALFMGLFPRELPRTAVRRARRNAAISRAANAVALDSNAGGSAMALTTVPAALQPPPAPSPPTDKRSLRDFGVALRRMVSNKILLFNTLSGVCFMFGFTGYWTFMPKYMETQYRQSASTASLISGSVGLVFSGLGIAASALVISRWKPRARTLAAWSVAVEVVDVVGHASWAFLSCGLPDLHGSPGAPGGDPWNLTTACNADCGCGPGVKYEPVCSLAASTTFYSPCHAGCPAPSNGSALFSGCACSPDGLVVAGACPRECAFNFGLFLASQCLMRLLGSSGMAGITLIQLRCVREEDKSLAMAFGEFLVAALAFIPAPILYGSLLDSACLVWGEMCGQPGNCWLYDDQKLRYLLNFTAGGCLFCGVSLDIAVWYLCKDLEIYEEGIKEKETLKEKVEDKEEVTPFLKNTSTQKS